MAKRAYGTGSLYVKDGAWYGRWRTVDGRRQARKIGPARGPDQLSKKQAEAALREVILLAERPARPLGGEIPVAQLGRMLVARLERQGRKRSHVESVRYHLSAHIDPLLGELKVHELGEDDVRRLTDRMLRAGRAPKTVRNVLGTLHSTLQVAVDERLIDRNPCQLSRVPQPASEAKIRFLTQAELARVLAAAPSPEAPRAERDWWPVVRLLVLTAAMTGMRLGELRALRWEDLDMAAMKVRVTSSFVRGEFGAPKSRRSVRAIPLASRLVSELDAHHQQTVWNQDADLVLAHPHTGRPLDRVRLLLHFKAALIRADVRPVRIHDLRHTFATTIAASGQVSLRTLQEWLGHRDARTTQIYADYMPGEREAEMVDAAFGGQSVANPRDTRHPDPPESTVDTAWRHETT